MRDKEGACEKCLKKKSVKSFRTIYSDFHKTYPGNDIGLLYTIRTMLCEECTQLSANLVRSISKTYEQEDKKGREE